MSITPGGAQPLDADAVVFTSEMLNPSGTGFLSELWVLALTLSPV